MLNPNRSLQYRIAHLLRTYETHSNIVIGVDFDHTLVDSTLSSYPLMYDIAKILQDAQNLGCILCVWTANTDEDLVRSKWLEAGLTVDYYNDSPITIGDSPKKHFNLLLDDTAGLNDAYNQLNTFIKEIS